MRSSVSTFTHWTELQGGKEGKIHQFQAPNSTLIAVKGRVGSCIDQIQFLFSDIATGKFIQSPVWGGNGGNQFLCRALPGQWIDRILLKVDSKGNLSAIEVESNEGVRSGKRGMGDKDRHLELNAKGKKICGVQCKVGKYINALGVLLLQQEEEDDDD